MPLGRWLTQRPRQLPQGSSRRLGCYGPAFTIAWPSLEILWARVNLMRVRKEIANGNRHHNSFRGLCDMACNE
jgi:hypothetical protein